MAPREGVAPDEDVAPREGVAPDEEVAPEEVAPDDGVAPDAPEAPDPEVTPTATSPDRARIDFERARDKALVEVALGGDLDAFNHLVELHQDHLFGVAFRVVGDRETAADAVQEAFLSAYRNLSRFRGDSFRSWLTRITVNAATDVLRSRKRRPADPYPEWEDETWQPPADEADGPEQRALVRQRSRTIAQALARIGEDQRIAIVLFDVEGYDYQEIAEMTGVSLGTVKSRIHRGRLALRDLLVDHLDLLRG
jgi:RNA polymerase sigma-70 factor (ECF subfamily)